MLIPRHTRWRKQHCPIRSGLSEGSTRLAFGFYGIQALEPTHVTNRQIEAARVAMTRHVKCSGEIWVNIFPDHPLTKKVLGLRMGSGKGPVEAWVTNIKPGRTMFEMDGVSERPAHEAMLRVMYKLPMKIHFVTRKKGE